MAPPLSQTPEYKRYLETARAEMDLPVLGTTETNGNSHYQNLHPGEAYCRFPGCENVNMFSTVQNLRGHYRRKHPATVRNHQTETEQSRMKGGRPTDLVLAAARRFYKTICDDLDEKARARLDEKLPLPLKTFKGRKSVNLTRFRETLLERFPRRKFPCVACDSANAPRECCTLQRLGECDHLAEFDTGEFQAAAHGVKIETV